MKGQSSQPGSSQLPGRSAPSTPDRCRDKLGKNDYFLRVLQAQTTSRLAVMGRIGQGVIITTHFAGTQTGQCDSVMQMRMGSERTVLFGRSSWELGGLMPVPLHTGTAHACFNEARWHIAKLMYSLHRAVFVWHWRPAGMVLWCSGAGTRLPPRHHFKRASSRCWKCYTLTPYVFAPHGRSGGRHCANREGLASACCFQPL